MCDVCNQEACDCGLMDETIKFYLSRHDAFTDKMLILFLKEVSDSKDFSKYLESKIEDGTLKIVTFNNKCLYVDANYYITIRSKSGTMGL